MPRTPAEALARLIEALDRLEIPYAVVGSVASSTHGIPRTTLNVDLVVDFDPGKIDEFASELEGDFYVDAELIRESFARDRAANLIHLATAWKFDLFPLGKDEYSKTGFGRRSFRDIQPGGTEKVECAVASAEDTVLRKLEWYRAGGGSSERQWSDLLGVCRTLGARLDVLYLRRWATHLNVKDLLEQLRVVYRGQSSSPLIMKAGPEKTTVSVDQPAYAGMPIWLKVELPFANGTIQYPYYFGLAGFGCNEVEVRRNGQALPLMPAPNPMQSPLRAFTGDICRPSGEESPPPVIGRLPLHLLYDLRAPGRYEVRFTLRSQPFVAPSQAGFKVRSEWTPFEILP